MWICPPPRSLDTFWRASPICVSRIGAGASLANAFLGLRVPGGGGHRLDLLHPGDARVEGGDRVRPLDLDRGFRRGVAGLDEVDLVAFGEHPEVEAAGLPPDELPVGFVVLLEPFVLRAGLGCELARPEPVLLQDLLDGVADGHLLEHADLAVAHQPVAAVERADAERDAAVPEVRVDGDDIAVEDGRRRRLVVDGAGLERRLRADLERLAVDVLDRLDLVVGVDEERQVEAVRERQAVDDLDLADPVLVLGVEVDAVEPEVVARDVLLGDGGRGAHESILGMVSGRPRVRCSGLSMSLASAMSRQRVGSP